MTEAMAAPRKLSRPPIAEALIDLRVAGAKVAAQDLEPLANRLRYKYPALEPVNTGTAEFQTREGKLYAETRDFGLAGFRLRSVDTERMVQLFPDRMTFNRLPEYTSADDLIEEALAVWSAYLEAVRPEAVVRIAMRYINRFTLPFKRGDDLDRFLTAGPTVPSSLPQEVPEFLSRVVLVFSETVMAIVTQTLQSVSGPSAVVLDLEVFRQGPLEGFDVAPVLAELRAIKNDCFFSHLTEEAVSLFV